VKSTPKNHLLFDDKMLLLLHSSLRIGVFSTSECCFYVNIFSREGYDKILSSFHSGIRLNKFVNQKSFRDLQYPETLPEPIFFCVLTRKNKQKNKIFVCGKIVQKFDNRNAFHSGINLKEVSDVKILIFHAILKKFT